MTKAKLSLVTQGVMGGKIGKVKHIGFTSLYLDGYNIGQNNRISIDSFTGQGESYKRLDECKLVVEDRGTVIFRGTRTEFMENLKFGTEIRNLKK